MRTFTKYLFFILFLTNLSLSVHAQHVMGKVVSYNDKKIEPLIGALVHLSNSNLDAMTGVDADFHFDLTNGLPDTLITSYVGYKNDTTILVAGKDYHDLEIVLFADNTLPEVIIAYKKNPKSISKINSLAVEIISVNELRKAACCNLSESFETNASVDVNMTDAISGAKTIQMMGLDGVYTQIQFENIPYLRGLEQPFGMATFPGTWINSIQITKGTGNVVNGYESMAGLVNIEMYRPESMPKVFVNGYLNRFGRVELNAQGSIRLNKKWSTAIFGHSSGTFAKNDANNDNFLDMPRGYLFTLNNRWNYHGEKMEAQIGANTYYDSKTGGQVNYKRNSNSNLYGMENQAIHFDLYAKTGFFLKKPYNSVGVIYNFKYQDNEALFGKRVFKGSEKRGYINTVFESIIGNTFHKYKVGASAVIVDMKQQLDSLQNNRLEIVPGAFAEYTYSKDKVTIVLGARADYHNLYKFQFSPRVHAKFALSKSTDLRITAGRGWRVPNYIIDNISLMATSKEWIAPTQTQPEISWNFGGSIVQEFKLFGSPASIVVDYYHTLFEQQLIADRDEDIRYIIFKNWNGKSFSNSFQAEFAFSPTSRFDIRLAYKFLDVRAEYGNQLQQKIMVPKHRGFINLAYQTRNKKWNFDLTTSVFGVSRLMVSQLDATTFTTDNLSKIYPQLSTQITYKHKKWDFYIGAENLTNYKQKNPIIDAENPFGTYFDATRIWAPLTGANVYAGFRFTLEHPKE